MRSSAVLEHYLLKGSEEFTILRVKSIRPEWGGKSGSASSEKRETVSPTDCGGEERLTCIE